MSTDDWQSQKFRQNVIAKINEMLQANGQDPSKNAAVMENHIFKKSRTKDEYLGLVAKLFVHFKDLTRAKQAAPQNNDMGHQVMIQDPLNALQNLASQGNRNPQMMAMGGVPNANQMGAPGGPVPASNLLQTLNHQRPGQQQMQQMQGIRGQIPMGAGGPGKPGLVSQMNNMQMMGGNAGGGGMPAQLNGPMGPAASQAGPNNMQAQMHLQNPGLSVQQIQQMSQKQMMGMNHSQLSQMMSARMSQSAPGPGMNVNSGNVIGNQGLSGNLQQNPNNVSGQMLVNGPAVGPGNQGGPHAPTNAGPQTSNLSQMLNMPPHKPNMQVGGNQLFAGNRAVPGGPQQFIRQSASPVTSQQQQQQVAQQQLQQQMQQQQQPQQQQQLQQGQPQQQQQPRAHTPQQGPGTPQPSPQQQQQQGPTPQQQQQQQQASQGSTTQMIPSPALAATNSPQMPSQHMGMAGNQRNISHQSPSGPGSVPNQMNANSPFNPNEEHLYREKYKQLTKYIEPLKRMLDRDRTNSDKMAKMNKLLEILSNPSQRVPLETLLKCEKALEKMELSQMSESRPSPASAPTSVSAPSPAGSVPSPAQAPVVNPALSSAALATVAIGKSANPLLEVVTTTMQSPLANHTLYRTFRPVLDSLFGTDIMAPKKIRLTQPADQKSEQQEFKVPHTVQGEVARLDQKFKVKLDQSEKNNTKSIRLVCALDDKRLPSVPPVHITIPEEYPDKSPNFSISAKEYRGTRFLANVRSALIARITQLPQHHSLTHLLDCWEMSVRQACSPNAKRYFHDLQAIYGV